MTKSIYTSKLIYEGTRKMSPEVLKAAKDALKRLENRKNEDVDEWAAALAKDISDATD